MSEEERCPWCGAEITRAKFDEITSKIRAEEQSKAQAQESKMKKTFETQFASRLEEEKKKSAEATKSLLEQSMKLQLDEQRIIFDAALEKGLAKRDAEHKREMEKTQSKLKELGRQLEKKTANELGELPEIDLYETLRRDYPDDEIQRVKPGAAGADIHQTVKHRSKTCGLIILDSKNHMAWRNDFASKLRQDQIDAKADHAILSTTVFPSGKRELCILNSVVVVSPSRVTHIVQILRDAMIRLHIQGLSVEERQTKVEQLYRLITSEEYSQKLAEAIRLSEGILNLEVDEQRQHQKTWKTRGTLATKLKKTLQEIGDDVYSVIGGKGTEEFDEQAIAHDEEVPF